MYVASHHVLNVPNLNVVPKRETKGAYGATVSLDVCLVLATVPESGQSLSPFSVNGKTLPLFVRLPQKGSQ